MNTKKEFYYKYFYDNILPLIEPIEQERLSIIRRAVLTSVLFFLIGIIFAGLFVFNTLYKFFNPIILPLLLFFMYAFILKSIINIIIAGKNYQRMLVNKVLPLFFEPFANFKKWPLNSNTQIILESNLFNGFDIQQDKLSFFGVYRNINVTVSDTSLTLPVKSERVNNLFKGTVIQIDFPYSINNHVIMLSKNERILTRYKLIESNIEELNKFLYVFSKNSNNIQFVNEDFWTILKRFGELYTAKGFLLSFKDDVLLIALRQKRPLEFGFLFKSLKNAKNYDELIERFIVIFDLIDNLYRSF